MLHRYETKNTNDTTTHTHLTRTKILATLNKVQLPAQRDIAMFLVLFHFFLFFSRKVKKQEYTHGPDSNIYR